MKRGPKSPMLRFLLRRGLSLAATLFLVITLAFLLIRLAPEQEAQHGGLRAALHRANHQRG
jgi:ABC-type dipeptide/oligopeptide/nickel transport system permease component